MSRSPDGCVRAKPAQKRHGAQGPSCPVVSAFGIMILIAVVWIWFRVYTGICLEDALITYRYAENLAGGRGFVFSPGERVMGTTTPLFTIMLAMCGAVLGVRQIPVISSVCGILAGLGAGWLTYALCIRLQFPRWVALFALAALCLHPDTLWTSTGGMETPLVLLFMALSLYAVSSGRYSLAALASSLLVFTRPDGVIWAAMIAGIVCTRDRTTCGRSLGIGLLILVPWVAFSSVYFGSPVPHSLVAKRAMSHYTPVSLTASEFKAYFLWVLASLGFPARGKALSGVFWLWACFVVAGAVSITREPRRRFLWPVAVFPVLFGGALWLGRAPRVFQWYLLPVTWCGIILGTAGIAAVWEHLAAWCRAGSIPRACARVIMGASLCFLAAGLYCRDRQECIYQRGWQINENGLRQVVGEWLREHTPEGSSVAMEAIGYQGVYSGRRIIDLAGLVSPDVVKTFYESTTSAEAFFKIVRDLRPDYMVLRSYEVDRNICFRGGRLFDTEEQRRYFMSHYREAKRFSAPLPMLWGPLSYLTVYARGGWGQT